MRNLFVFIVALVVLALAAYGVWQLVPHGEVQADLGTFMQPLLEETVEAAVTGFQRRAMPSALYVFDFQGEGGAIAKALVIEVIRRRGLAKIIEEVTLGEKLGGSGFLGTLAKELFGKDPTAAPVIGQAVTFVKKHELPGFLTARVAVKETEQDGSVDLRLLVFNAAQGRFHESQAQRTYAKGLFSWPYMQSQILEISVAWRLLGWLLFLIVLPIALSPLLIRRLRRESNVTNAVSIVALTVVAALTLWFALALKGGLVTALAVGVLGVGASGVYHYLILDFLEDLRR